MSVVPIHSHNDELHKVPLFDALEAKARCIEADVYLIDEEWKLGHAFNEYLPQNFDDTYLNPLIKLYEKNGKIYDDNISMILLIDCKIEESVAANYTRYSVEDFYTKMESFLRLISEKHPGIFTIRSKSKVTLGAIDVILSGTRPSADFVLSQNEWILSLDGRKVDLDRFESSPLESYNVGHVYPIFSDALAVYLNGTRFDPTPELDSLKPYHHDLLMKSAKTAHKYNSLFRVWGCPDSEASWKEQLRWGADLVSTDETKECAAWLNGHGFVCQQMDRYIEGNAMADVNSSIHRV